MTSLPFLGAQILYGLLSLISLVDYWRYRDRPRLVVALTFGSFAGFILTQDLLELGFEPSWLVTINRLLLLVHPFLLVRLVDYVAPVPRPIRRFALGGLVLLGLLDVLLPAARDGLTGLLILGYFIIFEGYAAGAAVLGARRVFSVPRRRLVLAAVGSGLLALVLIYLLLTGLFPVLAPHIDWVVPLVLSASALCHYLGFATPRWLRHTWQMNELYNYLRKVGERPAAERAECAYRRTLPGGPAHGGRADGRRRAG